MFKLNNWVFRANFARVRVVSVRFSKGLEATGANAKSFKESFFRLFFKTIFDLRLLLFNKQIHFDFIIKWYTKLDLFRTSEMMYLNLIS